MSKISSGIKSLDSLIDSLYIGDNVVWEVNAGTSYDIFIKRFVRQSFDDSQKVTYISFNKSPQSVLNEMKSFLNPDYFMLVDCFTSGKGKNDNTFFKFYEKTTKINVVKIDNPRDIEQFISKLNSIEDSFSSGVRYVFDSLTGMQDLWGNENDTYKFFTYMCPRLYDLGTVAYWILEKEAHSQMFKANLRHITQVVFDLYERREKLFIKALKLVGRPDREAFKPFQYEVDGEEVKITHHKKELSFDIGSKIREARVKLGMSQKDLANKIDMTSSFISQIESSQISPSLSSFLQIADVLGLNPTQLFQKDTKSKDLSWLIKQESVKQNLFERTQDYSIYNIVSNGSALAYITIINSGKHLNKHFSQHKKHELIHVLKGRVAVKIDNEERELKMGDSIYLKDSVPAEWKNKTDGEAELLVFCT